VNNYEIVFQKLIELTECDAEVGRAPLEASVRELDELEELRRFSAELREPEPLSLTSTI
jgi:hypothetical protein